MLSVTNIGLAAITRADMGGFLLNLGSFKVTEYDISAKTDLDKIEADDVLGTVAYEGGVTAIETVDTSSIRLTLTIPVSVPESGGKLTLRELGVYLETGELFAYGALDPEYEKTNEFSIKIYVVVTANRLAETINVVVSQNNSLPSVAYVRQLVSPRESEQNVVVVLDEDVHSYGSAASGFAVKSGPGGLHWAYSGHDRIYQGRADSVLSRGQFIVFPETGGFWLNDGEVVIVQIVAGEGAGQSRKMVYRKLDHSFNIIDKEFLKLGDGSVVALWRNIKNQLPKRDESIPEYFVLGVGTNTWQQAASSGSKIRYDAIKVSGTLDASGKLIDARLATLTADTAYVFTAAACLNSQQYSLANTTLTVLEGIGPGRSVDVQGFVATTSDVGGLLSRFESKTVCDGTTSRYYLPVVADSDAWIMLFLDNVPVLKSQYTFEDTSVVFNTLPEAGKELHVIIFATYDDDAAYSEIVRSNIVLTSPQTELAYSSELYDKAGTIVYVGGEPLAVDEYDISTTRLKILKQINYGDDNQVVVDISVFKSLSSLSTAGVVSGIDTGPVWVDPAGVDGFPNKLIPKVRSHVSDGTQLVFAAYPVPKPSHLLVFAGSVFQDPRNYVYGSGKITLGTAIPAGLKVDIISFTELRATGSSVLCTVQNLTLTDSLAYNLNTEIDDADSVFVFIGGAYQHKATYYINTIARVLNLQETIPGQAVEIWYFKTEEHLGWRTTISLDLDVANAENAYPLSEQNVLCRENTLQFLGYVYQNKAGYLLSTDSFNRTALKYSEAIDPVLYSQQSPAPNIVHTFVSGPLKTRLLLREDGDLFMPRYGPYVEWDNLSKDLRNRLACPLTKLLGLVSGVVKMDLNSGDADADKLASEWGLQQVTKTLSMDIIPTANYASIGAGAALGVPVRFNVFKYLEIYLRQELGDASFSVKKYEQGKKYLIDDIKLGDLKFEALARADIPMLTLDTGIFIDYPNKIMSSTYPTMPMLTSFLDMRFSMQFSTLPAGFDVSSSKLRSVSVSTSEDTVAETRTYTHRIQDDYSNREYTVIWKRPMVISAHNDEYLTCLDAGGAPGYVQYFARLYANWQYNDADLRLAMWYNKYSVGTPGSDASWWAWQQDIRSGSQGGNYPAVAGYTAGLAFAVKIDNVDMDTGGADLTISMTSGVIGYSYFPAQMLVKTITVPTTYTIYPGMKVNPDGSIDPMFSSSDLFTSCCWTGLTLDKNGNPYTDLGCGTSASITIPTVSTAYTYAVSPTLTGKYPATTRNMNVTINNVTYNSVARPDVLVLDSGVWTLNLAKAGHTLTAGSYDVVVEAIDSVGNKTYDDTLNEIVIRKQAEIADIIAPTRPTVNAQTTSSTSPTITGTYPILDSAGGFTVLVGNTTFTLGVSTALTAVAGTDASGNTIGLWTLNLETAGKILSEGVYSVTAVVRDAAGNAASDATSNELVIDLPDPVEPHIPSA